MRLTIDQVNTLQQALKELAEYRSYDEGMSEEFKQTLNDTMGLFSDEQSLYDKFLLLSSRVQPVDTPDTIVIDISSGIVDEISANVPIHVILLDSDLDSLDIEDMNETFELNGTRFATRDTGHASYNPSRTELVHKAVQERDAIVQAQKEARIQTELLTQEDYDRFNEIFRVETLALGRSVIKTNLYGHEYVDEEVFGKEEEMRLIPLKIQGRQFQLNAPVIKPVIGMIADFVRLSKLHDFDAKSIATAYLKLGVKLFNEDLDMTQLKEPLRRDVVESLFNMEYNDVERTMTYDEQSASLKRILKSAPRTVEQAIDLIHAELHQ